MIVAVKPNLLTTQVVIAKKLSTKFHSVMFNFFHQFCLVINWVNISHYNSSFSGCRTSEAWHTY